MPGVETLFARKKKERKTFGLEYVLQLREGQMNGSHAIMVSDALAAWTLWNPTGILVIKRNVRSEDYYQTTGHLTTTIRDELICKTSALRDE